MVLLVTGKCARRCGYCPLSSEKKGKDVFFANERRIETVDEALDEAVLMDALGTGITGGDPLTAVQRTAHSIRALKKRFGEEHHIHLYTSTTDTEKIARVARAGLDEIRFHPPVSYWSKLERTPFASALKRSKRKGMAVGLEVPVIPGRRKDLQALVRAADSLCLDFINLNELEFSETNWRTLRNMGFDVKDDVSSAVDGSQELAIDILRSDEAIALHYCSSAFKDGVQLRNRIARRAKNVRRSHEVLTDDSTLLKGVVETDDPAATRIMLAREFDVPGRLMWVDDEKRRLEVAPWVLEEIASELPLPSFIVEEYPTADRLEVEREPLRRR